MNTKHLIRALAALAACGLLTLAPSAGAHEGHDHGKPADAAAAPKTDAAHDAMMAEMMKNAQPGPDHAVLAEMTGTWKAKLKSWFAPGPPTESEGTMVNSMILGGRVLEGKFSGSFMGQPMKGVSMMGYDNSKKEYWSLWADDMSTGTMWQLGGPAKDKVIAMKGSMQNPDGSTGECYSKTKMVDKNTHVYTMTTMMAGKEVPLMEITYTRQ